MPAVGTARAELFSDGREEFIELSYELICVCSVNLAGICDGFASGAGAAEAMHTDLEEELCTACVDIEKIADDSILGNLNHWTSPFPHSADPFFYILQ